jgi:glycosyltransferase involved in cell wall biosynthesis
MRLPKLSIVTPSFNQGLFLEETIRSVLQQNYKNLEYIVIDGGSSDNSVDIIKKYESSLHYWVSEKDEGHGHAINKGFSHASGDIMAWINSDDKYTPWSLQVVAEIFSRFPHVMWIVGFNSWWNDAGAMLKAKRCPKNIFDFLLGNYAWIQQESVFWRKTLWDAAGGYVNQNYKLMIDGELWTRFFLHAELYSVDCILGGYRMHSSNRARDKRLCCKEMEAAIEEMKNHVPQEIHNLCKIVKGIRKSILLFRSFFIGVLLRKNTRAKFAYKNIKYTNGAWRERCLPFNFI